jgi:hypothetical protein
MNQDLSVTVNLTELYDMLEKHDWYHAFSDDNRVYQNGAESFANIMRKATTPDAKALVQGYEAYMFSGPNFGKPASPKPEKP